MSIERSAIRVLGVIGATTAALLAFAVLGSPSLASAQQPSARAADAQLPVGYVRAETCKGCHEEIDQKFAATKMGRLFLKHPRNPLCGSSAAVVESPANQRVVEPTIRTAGERRV